jgi:DNA-binding MarR family transcriptional regulator
MISQLPKPSPHKTDLKFDGIDYAMYSTCWIKLIDTIKKTYKVTLTQCRVLCSVRALMSLYGFRLNGEGITASDISRITLFNNKNVTKMMLKLAEQGLIQYTEEVNGKRIIRYYKPTRRGQGLINKLTDTEKVNEQIVSHLYRTKLLK